MTAREEAGQRYDDAVRDVWAGIDPQLSTRQAWALARPGMVAAQQRLDRELTAASREGALTAHLVVTRQADDGLTPDQIDASAERVLSGRFDQPTPQSDAFHDEYDTTAAIYAADLRDLDRDRERRLPEPGAPHPDAFLAGRGWHGCDHGIYVRHQAQPAAGVEREAG